MSTDGELLARVARRKDLFRLVLYDDSFDDWTLVRDLGEFLVRTEDSEIMGHAILARALRHLGDRRRALVELERCRTMMNSRQLHSWETDLFPSLLAGEGKQLSSEGNG